MTQIIDTAMIMTAGLGTRMSPLTNDRPKSLIEIAGKPLIDHVLDRLVATGVRRIVSNLHYKAEMIEAHLSSRTDVEVLFSDERDARLETGGGIKQALPLIDRDTFLVANTDAFWIEGYGSNLQRMFAAWKPEVMDSLILCAPTVGSIGSIGRGDFLMRSDGRLERRTPACMAPFMMAGVYILERELFQNMPDGPFSTNLVWDKAEEAGRLFGHRLEGIWLHASAPRDIEEIERTLSEL